jgi:four helix bundle protein
MAQNTNQGFKNLTVYQLAFKLAVEIFHITKKFPSDEKYELTSQIRRSSRAVCSNIAEGYRKRKYPKHFSSKMTDANGEASESIVWLDFAENFGYLTEEDCFALYIRYEEVGRILGSMAMHPEKFLPKQNAKSV